MHQFHRLVRMSTFSVTAMKQGDIAVLWRWHSGIFNESRMSWSSSLLRCYVSNLVLWYSEKRKTTIKNKFEVKWVSRLWKVTLPRLVLSQWQWPFNLKKCFCHSSALPLCKILEQYHYQALVEALTNIICHNSFKGEWSVIFCSGHKAKLTKFLTVATSGSQYHHTKNSWLF